MEREAIARRLDAARQGYVFQDLGGDAGVAPTAS